MLFKLSIIIFTSIFSLNILVAEESSLNTLEKINVQASGIFNITKYGIDPNSTKDAVPAILKAAEAAIAYANKTGQTAEVFVPTGNFFVSQFQLRGLKNVNLHLGENAKIYAFKRSKSVDGSKAYITINECSDCIIYGEKNSLFDGAGASWWSSSQERPDFMSFTNCNNYEVYGFSVNNSPNHTIRLSSCKNGIIHDLSIVSPPDSPNTDGIDPMSKIDGLEIYNCFISNGDDGFAINSSTGSMNNIHIHDCVLMHGHGMSFGSSINYDITNVLIEDLTIDGAWHGARIKCAESDKVAHLKNIKFKNIKAKNLTRDAILITTEYSDKPNTKVTFEDISISNFTCDGAKRGLKITLTKKKQAINPLILNSIKITNTEEEDEIENYPIIWDGKPL